MSDNDSNPFDREDLRETENRIHQRHRLLEEDAERLKGRVRFLTVGLVLALGLNMVTIFSPGITGLPGRVHASGALRIQHLVLQDAAGNQRGDLRVDEEGNSRLALMDRQANPRLSLSVLSGGSPGMSLIDASGNRRVALAFLPDETANLVFADRNGVSRVVLGLNPAGATSLVFADANGSSQAALGLDSDGFGVLVIPQEVTEATPGEEGEGGQ